MFPNQKEVGSLDIAMQDVGAMQSIDSIGHFPCEDAKLLLREVFLLFAPLHHQLQEISSLCELHNQAEMVLLEESLAVLYDIGMR